MTITHPDDPSRVYDIPDDLDYVVLPTGQWTTDEYGERVHFGAMYRVQRADGGKLS